jgi:hypothetical protein
MAVRPNHFGAALQRHRRAGRSKTAISAGTCRPKSLSITRGTEGSNPSPSSGESGANLTSSIMLGYARSDSGPCRLGPTHAVIALVSAPGSTLADSHVAGPRGRSEEWYYKRGFWPRPFHYTEENRQRMLDPIEADD